MLVKKLTLDGALLIKANRFEDDRGSFLENYQLSRYLLSGIDCNFVQDNLSRSKKNVLRGLHYQIKRPQAQLLTVIRGSVFDVIVDLRKNSKTFGHSIGVDLCESSFQQIYMPPGVAHGFCVKSDFADLHYKVTEEYDRNDEGGILWCDPQLNIRWPIDNPIVGSRDSHLPMFKNINLDMLPQI